MEPKHADILRTAYGRVLIFWWQWTLVFPKVVLFINSLRNCGVPRKTSHHATSFIPLYLTGSV